MTLKDEKNAAKTWSESVINEHGMERIREVLIGQRIDILPNSSVTCFDTRKVGSDGAASRFIKGSVPHGARPMITGVRSGARHRFILVCSIPEGEVSNITFSGKNSIDTEHLGVEITAYDMPGILPAYDTFQQLLEDKLFGFRDPRFDAVDEAAEQINNEELEAEGFGSW